MESGRPPHDPEEMGAGGDRPDLQAVPARKSPAVPERHFRDHHRHRRRKRRGTGGPLDS